MSRLDPASLRAWGPDRVLRLVDDERLEWGDGRAADILLQRLPDEAQARPLAWLDAHAEQLIADYYRSHPLTRTGFDRQVAALLERYGADAFAAPPGHLPRFTLFVDAGTLVAEPEQGLRYRYGAYCELTGAVSTPMAARRVAEWLARGEAYAAYLSMNVCRYNC